MDLLVSRLNSLFPINNFKAVSFADIATDRAKDDEELQIIVENRGLTLFSEDYSNLLEGETTDLEEDMSYLIKKTQSLLKKDEVAQFFVDKSQEVVFQADDKFCNTIELLCIYKDKVEIVGLSLTLS